MRNTTKPTRLDFARIKELIYANPESVAASLGIPTTLFNGKHQPSPLYGGTDCFQYNRAKQCFSDRKHPDGGGDLIALFMEILGVDYRGLMAQVNDALGLAFGDHARAYRQPPEVVKPTPKLNDYTRVRNQWRNRLRDPQQSHPAHCSRIVFNYAIHRGIAPSTLLQTAGGDLYGVFSLGYWHKNETSQRYECLGEYPALVGVLRDLDGRAVAIQRIYLNGNGVGKAVIDNPNTLTPDRLDCKKLVKLADSYQGASVFVGGAGADKHIAVCEGIETALAVLEMTDGMPTYAAINSGNLKHFKAPQGVQAVSIYADNDKAGLEAAEALKRRLTGQGLWCVIIKSSTAGADALDFLNDIKHTQKHSTSTPS